MGKDSRLENAEPTQLDGLRKILAEQNNADALCSIEMKEIIIRHNAIADLPDVLARTGRNNKILMVSDKTRILREDQNLKEEIYALLKEKFDVEWLVLSEGDENIHTTLDNSQKIQNKLSQAGCVLAVGSGTVTDLCKHATYYHNENDPLPLVVFQTALSVNAFSDGVSVMLLNGVKRTIHSRYPTVLAIDLDVIEKAPAEMNVSGYGDLIATWTAPVDWYLSHTIGMNPNFHEAPAEMIRSQCKDLLERSENLKKLDEETIKALANTLTLSGLSMGIAGESSPCSGSEHIISHLVDMASKVRHTGICYHGTQVAVSGILASIIWDYFLNEFDPAAVDVDKCFPSKEEMEPKVNEAFAWLDDSMTAANECWSDYEKKLENWHANKEAFKAFLANFQSFKGSVKDKVLPPSYICECMHKAGAPTHYKDLNFFVDEKTVRWAIKSCHLMRNRFTVIDLMYYTGLWNEAFIERVLDRAREYDAGI
jgi:glycerol-1-phosphate dehydrogenase [NAD(P)+]